MDFVAPTVQFPARHFIKAETIETTSSTTTADTDTSTGQNTPNSLRELYNVNEHQGSDISRQACTAFLGQYYTETDLQAFYEEYYKPLVGTSMSDVVGPNDGKAGVEASLDAEYMTVMGSGVPTEFWSFAGRQPGAPANEPFLDWLSRSMHRWSLVLLMGRMKHQFLSNMPRE